MPDSQANAPVSVPQDGQYERVDLKKEMITVGVIQSRVQGVDGDDPEPGKQENLNHMLGLIDAAFGWGGPKDLICFHEFPIGGFGQWTRPQALKVAIENGGPEMEALGAKAKQYKCYITFGSYIRDADWPDHVITATTILGPDGEVKGQHWKPRHIHGLFGGIEMFTTTIYDVYDRYVEMYGEDAVVPVTRTDIGNIHCSSAQHIIEPFTVAAMKGAEIMIRTATAGFRMYDAQAISLYSGCYGIHINNAANIPAPHGAFQVHKAGGSCVLDPMGEVIAEASSIHEECITTRIPIGSFRQRNRLPDIPMGMFKSAFERYVPRYGPNAFLEALPNDVYEGGAHFKDKARW